MDALKNFLKNGYVVATIFSTIIGVLVVAIPALLPYKDLLLTFILGVIGVAVGGYTIQSVAKVNAEAKIQVAQAQVEVAKAQLVTAKYSLENK